MRSFIVLVITVVVLCGAYVLPVSTPSVLLMASELGDGAEAVQLQESKQTLNLEDWGIYNGCISSNHIRKIKVLDAHSAMLSLVDGKKAKIHFMKQCDGIKQHGFVYTARNNMFCTHSYSVRVLHTGTYCQVEMIEPYLDMDIKN